MKTSDWIVKKVAQIEKNYLDEPERIVQDYKEEQRIQKEYNGRQLLELIQNADDEAKSATKKAIHIKLYENTLTVANNGNPFSIDGIKSLIYAGISLKFKKQVLSIIL
ncbi:MAG: hypothetical protein CR982_04075 [Candidatus Cloacimonadota bacterium]|nr:MAG: hypothetical protein CR982_04075 [Candidatus Cloacimonadota bacterium]PIE77864.1 MAG: hypothetical protein CSA15_10785 [Candidatus Delongbacteria bacterium]